MITPVNVQNNSSHVAQTNNVDEIVILSFQNECDGNEISVAIEAPLSINSTIAAVMEEGGVYNEFGNHYNNVMTTPTGLNSNSTCAKFRIKKQNGLFYTFPCDKLQLMTVGSVIRYKNIDDDYLIVQR